MKAILKLKNKKIYLDWEFGYSKIPDYIKATHINKGAISFLRKYSKTLC